MADIVEVIEVASQVVEAVQVGPQGPKGTTDYNELTNVPSAFAPLPHKQSHKLGSGDAITPEDIGAAAAEHTHEITEVNGLQGALNGKQPSGTYVQRSDIQGGGSSYFERSVDAASISMAYGQQAHQVVLSNDSRLSNERTPTAHTHQISEISGAAASPVAGSHVFESPGQSYTIPEGRNQRMRITMSFVNGNATVHLPTTARAWDTCRVDANLGANCTLTVGGVALANTNQYYGTARRILEFLHSGTIWALNEIAYHEHTNANPVAAGFMSAEDKVKLNGLQASSSAPLAPGTASPGVSTAYARADHRHQR